MHANNGSKSQNSNDSKIIKDAVKTFTDSLYDEDYESRRADYAAVIEIAHQADIDVSGLLAEPTFHQDYQMIEHCLNHGADPNSILYSVPVCWRAESAKMAKLFVEKGAHYTGKNLVGDSALHYAMLPTHSLESVEFLVKEQNLNPKAVDNLGSTPLHHLARRTVEHSKDPSFTYSDKIEILKKKAEFLIQEGAAVLSENDLHETPRMILGNPEKPRWEGNRQAIAALDSVLRHAEQNALFRLASQELSYLINNSKF